MYNFEYTRSWKIKSRRDIWFTALRHLSNSRKKEKKKKRKDNEKRKASQAQASLSFEVALCFRIVFCLLHENSAGFYVVHKIQRYSTLFTILFFSPFLPVMKTQNFARVPFFMCSRFNFIKRSIEHFWTSRTFLFSMYRVCNFRKILPKWLKTYEKRLKEQSRWF